MLVKVARSKIVVVSAVAQQVVGDDQNGMADGHGGPALPPACGQSAVLGPQVRVLLAGTSMSCLHQQRPQPGTALAGPPAPFLARAFVVAWAHPRPTRQMSRTREPTHVGADLGDERFCQVRTDSGNGVEPCHRLGTWPQPLSDLHADPGNGGLDEVDVGQLLSDEETLVGRERSYERPLQLRK